MPWAYAYIQYKSFETLNDFIEFEKLFARECMES